jgi:uncharacterized membrane protein
MVNNTQNKKSKNRGNKKPNSNKPGYNLYIIIGIIVLFFGLQFLLPLFFDFLF